MTSFHKNLLIAGSFLFFIFLIAGPYLFWETINPFPEEKEKVVEEEEVKMEVEWPNVDVSAWKTYRNNWYGFEIKYPENWNTPVVRKASRVDGWEQRISFRIKEVGEDDAYVGFDAVVYNKSKVTAVSYSEEFPAKKSRDEGDELFCGEIEYHLTRDKNFPLEEVNISSEDDCFERALFYAFAFGQYAYNIVPLKNNSEKSNSTKEEVLKIFPEFFSAAASFTLTGVKRPKPAPRITAPMPRAETKPGPGGKRVCAKSGDKPSKSEKTGKKHLDMECCLDPDEYPNPNCYYSPSKYGKYL